MLRSKALVEREIPLGGQNPPAVYDHDGKERIDRTG
jgi:hypothetical protein